mgnify:CR=1 FL=1
MRRIIEIPPPVSQENAHEYATPQQNQEAERWIEKHSTKLEQESQDKEILDCPFCKRRLRIPNGFLVYLQHTFPMRFQLSLSRFYR